METQDAPRRFKKCADLWLISGFSPVLSLILELSLTFSIRVLKY